MKKLTAVLMSLVLVLGLAACGDASAPAATQTPADGSGAAAQPGTGKTVIPFATSSTSDMGQSGTLLADMAGTGDWQDGQRFASGASASDVQSWVNGLGR